MRTGDLDRRVLRSGTTLRFALLVVFTTAATVRLSSTLGAALRGTGPVSPPVWCAGVAGVVPEQQEPVAITPRHGVGPALGECVVHTTPGAWRDAVAATVVVYAFAAAVYVWLPTWRHHRRRLVPVPPDSELGCELRALAERAGLAREPRFMIDPGAHTTGAVVFGRWKRHTVCLHGGLLTRRAADPQTFRTVALHELAHIRNRDVDIVYATEALWRVSAVLVLAPAVLLAVFPRLGEGSLGATAELWHHDTQAGLRGLLDVAVLIGLSVLARADVLRTRELYADLDAVRWARAPAQTPTQAPTQALTQASAQAPPTGAPPPAPPPSPPPAFLHLAWKARSATKPSSPVAWRYRLRRRQRRAARLFRTHPDWSERAASLRRPDVLYGTHSSTMVITGIAAVMAMVGLASVRPHEVSGRIPLFGGSATTWLMAALLAGIAGVALWRRVVFAVATGAPVPAGLRAGFWLGVGVALGELVSFRAAGRGWLPDRPGWLLVPVVVACVLTWWAAQCAELWVAGSRGRSLRPVHLAALGVFFVVVGAWLVWWETIGRLYLAGVPGGGVDTEAFGPDHATGTPDQIDALRSWWPLYRNIVVLIHHPLVLTGGAALWLFPLIAWGRRVGPCPPAWLRRALRGREPETVPQASLPRFRSLLLLSLAGGTLCLGAVVVARLALRPDTPAPGAHGSAWMLQVTWWHAVALIAACAVWAAGCAGLATRCRAAVALASAGMAMCVGLAGTYLLASTEGCVPGVGVMAAECRWYGQAGRLMVGAVPGPLVMGLGMFVVTAAALLGDLARSAIDRRRTPVPPPPRPAHAVVSARRVAARRVVVGAVVTVVVVAVVHWWDPSDTADFGEGSVARTTGAAPRTVPAPSPARSPARGVGVPSGLVGEGEELGHGVPVAGGAADLEGPVDQEGQLGCGDPARQVEVDLAFPDGHVIRWMGVGRDAGERGGVHGLGVERHQEPRRVAHLKGIGVDHGPQLVGGADHDLDVALIGGRECGLDGTGHVGGRGLLGAQDGVAALEQSPHVGVAEVGEERAQLRHRQCGAPADVDSAQERDVPCPARSPARDCGRRGGAAHPATANAIGCG